MQGLIGKACECGVGFLVIELQIRQRLHGGSDKMSRISVHGRVAVLGVRGEGVWELLISHPYKGALSEIPSQQGMISGEVLSGICRRSPQTDLRLSGSRCDLQTDLFHSKNEPLHPTGCRAKQGCFTADLFVHLLIVPSS